MRGQAGLGLPPGVGLGARCFTALGLGVPVCKVEPDKGASPRVRCSVCYQLIKISLKKRQRSPELCGQEPSLRGKDRQ